MKKLKDLLINFLMAFLFFAGILLAGSDGDWFPWINFVGALMLGILALLANYMRPSPRR